MKRRILALLLVMSLVFALALGVSADETEAPTSALSLAVTNGKGSVTISVYLEGCDGVTNGRLSVCYDSDLLTFAQAETTGAYAMSSVNSETAGTVYLAWVGSELTAEKTLMLTLTLTTAQTPTQPLRFTAASEGIYIGTEAIDAAAAEVTTEYVPAVDTAALEQAIAAAEALSAADYTEASYAAVESALAEAILVLADSEASQQQVDDAAGALTNAMAELVAIGSGSDGDPKTGDFSPIAQMLAVMLLCAVCAAGMTVYVIRTNRRKQAARFISMVLVAVLLVSLLPIDSYAVILAEDDTTVAEKLVDTVKNGIINGESFITKLEGISADLKLDQQVSSALDSVYADDDMVRVIVELEGKGLLEQGYTEEQISSGDSRAAADAAKLKKLQLSIAGQIEKIVGKSVTVKYHYTAALNGIAVTVPYGKLADIRGISGVKNAYVSSEYLAPESVQTDGSYDTSMYATANTFGSAETWNTLGYTGQGMKIAVLDTGLDVDHPSFVDSPADPSMTISDIEKVLTELNAYSLYSQTSALKLTAKDLYYSEKVPFGFNYVDCNTNISHDFDEQGDHGSHVAGTAAANAIDTTTVVGVAPDAQIIVMKLFGEDGGAYTDDILAAIEDCLLLDIDVINMSLGSPAGFTEDSVLVQEVFGRILENDVLLAVAAGNTGSAASGNSLGTNLNLTSDPDNGLVNSPSTYLGSTAVASLENTHVMMSYFTVGETKIPYVDVNYTFTDLQGLQEYVIVPNYGRAEDYEGLDVYGKIAVVSRGGGDDVTFVVKQENAYNAGAVALIVYDNTDGSYVSMYDGGFLPNVFISQKDGAKLIESAVDGMGTLEIMAAGVETPVAMEGAGQMSDFSCWGVTSDLQLMPDVTAPGGNIYSCYNDGQYGTMSGTSMASPHIAGMSALVLQYLHDVYPDLQDGEYHTIVESLVMCTADPILDPDGILYSPRKQGAGSANVYSAITSPVYLTSLQSATGELTPKASLGDDPERTGVFTFTFEMHNLTGTEQVYYLDFALLTDQYVEIDGVEYMGETGRNLTGSVTFELLNTANGPDYDANGDTLTNMEDVQFLLDAANGLKTLSEELSAMLDLYADGVINTVDAQLLYEKLLDGFEAQNLVTVPAGSTVSVNVTIALSEEDMAYMDAHYENGIYVDGFVRAYAQSEDAVDLSLPFTGFYGGWDEAPVFDSGWYYEDSETVIYNRYTHVLFATLGEGESYGGLGINPYLANDEYTPAHNVLSPNGDTYYDYIPEIYISMMRSAEILDFTWTDDATGQELFYEYYAYARKSYYWSAYGMSMPIVYTDGGLEPYTFYDENGNLMVEDLQKLTLTIRAYLDDGELDSVEVDENGNPVPDHAWADEQIVVPIVIDLSAPTLDVSSIVYTQEEGRTYVSFHVEDNYDIAAIVVTTEGGGAYEYIPVNTKTEGVDGEQDTIKLDITDFDATFHVVVCDYGCNETYYELVNPGCTGLNEDEFYAFRRYSTYESGDYIYTTDALNGWYSFEKADDMLMHTSQSASGEATVYAAEYVDGYIFGAQSGNNDYNTLFVMKAGSWDRIPLGSEYTMRKFVYEWPDRTGSYFPLQLIALDMTYDYTTGTMYMLANALENNYFPEGEVNILLSVDLQTGDVNVLGKIFPEDGNEEFLALTLACDSDGVLYTINYENGKLYTIGKTPAQTTANYGYGSFIASCVSTGEAKYRPAAYTQSMTIDQQTDTLYWAGYQGKTGTSCFIEMDKSNGEIIGMTYTEDNAELSGLIKPYDPGTQIIPSAALTGILLSDSNLYLSVGQNATLTVSADPYNAELGSITWTSLNEDVVTVSPYGIVEARGVGIATVVATCTTADGSVYEASCIANVSNVDGTLFAYSDGYWLLMDAGRPGEANQVADAMVLDGEVKASAYLHGSIYAAAVSDGKTNLYKLEAGTLSGELLGSYDGETTALAFNYADGFMYGLVRKETMDSSNNTTITYHLIRVNVNSGLTLTVTDLNSIYPYSDLTGKYQTCSGALAIDYEGNFYVSGDNANWKYNLVRFNLDDGGNIINITEYTDFIPYSYYGDSMVWSQRNEGLLHAVGDSLYWVDVSDMSNVEVICMGSIRGAADGTYALSIPLNSEPAVPEVAPTSISLEDSYTVPTSETVHVAPTTDPWNASGSFTYEIADPSVAVVDADGTVTGVSIGQTTLTVTETTTGLTATATIVVVKNPGNLYGYFQANLMEGIPLEVWGKIPLSNPDNYNYLHTDVYDLTIYAGAYYDGTVYACGQHTVDGSYYLLKINPSSFTYEIVGQADMMIRDMAFDYTTGTMYAVGYDEMITGGLYQVNLDTFEITLIGDNDKETRLVGLAVDNAGVMYAAGESGEIFTVNKRTVELTSTGIAGSYNQYLQSMTYDYNNDVIYWAKGGTLYTVDTDNAKLTTVGNLGCSVSCLFSVPEHEPQVPETVAPNGVALAEKNTVAVGDTLVLNAVVLPVSTAAVDQTLVWSSSDSSIATVDENGTVTGVAAGTAHITATDANGNSDSILITVTAERRYFYGYDELSRSWVSFDANGTIVGTWADDENLSPIVAAQYIDGVLYAYDADGYFYTVDTGTFQRTLKGNGIHGTTTSLEAWDNTHNQQVYYVDGIPYTMVDLTYSKVETKRGTVITMYGVLMAYNISTWRDSFSYKIVRLNMTDGTISKVIAEDALVDYEMSLRATNLIWRNDYLYTINGYITGMITRIDLTSGSVTGESIIPSYWGDFNGGRSMIEDPLTGEVYAIRDMRTEYIGVENYTGAYSTSVLCSMRLGVARCDELFTIGTNMRIVGLFIM